MRVLLITILAALVGVQTVAPPGFIINKTARKAYTVMYQAESWTRAREECQKIGATLAVPTTLEEFQFLQKLVRSMPYPQVTGTSYKLLVWLGISNIEDHTVWKNVDGEDIRDTGFSKWASNHVGNSSDPAEPHCAGMDAVNPGLRDYWCHLREPYVCQIKMASYGRPDYNNINEAVEHFIDEQLIYQER